MTAIVRDLVIEQGSTFALDFQVSVKLTGWTAKSQIRRTTRDSVLTSFSVVILDADTGKIRLVLSASQTRDLKVFHAVYDVKLTSPAGLSLRVLTGKITVSPEVTR